MTDRKGLADRLKVACEHCQRMTTVPTESIAALRQEPSVDEVARAIAAADGVTWDGRTVTYAHVSGSDDDGPTDRYYRAAQAIASLYRDKP